MLSKEIESKLVNEMDMNTHQLETMLHESTDRLKKAEKARRELEEKYREQKLLSDSRQKIGEMAKSLHQQLSETLDKAVDVEECKQAIAREILKIRDLI